MRKGSEDAGKNRLLGKVLLPAHILSHLTPTLHQKLLDKHGSGSLVLMSKHIGERKVKIDDTEGKRMGARDVER